MSALACALVGCGPGAPATPEAAVAALLEAAARADAGAFRGAFPSREEIAALFECPADIDLAKRFDGLSSELVAWRDARPELAAGGVGEVARVAVEPGDDVGGCKARRAMTLIRGDVRLREGGAEVIYAMRFIDVDGRVRVLGY